MDPSWYSKSEHSTSMSRQKVKKPNRNQSGILHVVRISSDRKLAARIFWRGRVLNVAAHHAWMGIGGGGQALGPMGDPTAPHRGSYPGYRFSYPPKVASYLGTWVPSQYVADTGDQCPVWHTLVPWVSRPMTRLVLFLQGPALLGLALLPGFQFLQQDVRRLCCVAAAPARLGNFVRMATRRLGTC